MFTGIIETLGEVKKITTAGSNKTFTIQSSISNELRIDQSIAHNGVCLTVIGQNEEAQTHSVTAIEESLRLTNLEHLIAGDIVNLERCMRLSDRLDGHIVQGHVDSKAQCLSVHEVDGSWEYTFKFDSKYADLLVNKGSICVNGVSLTLINPTVNTFQIAIIPYTHENTNFKNIQKDTEVNIEFDIIGKYILRKEALKKVPSQS